MIWFVYIAFNYLSVSLVELNKILYCGYLSLGAHSLVLWPSSFRHYNFHVNKSCFEASVFGHWGSSRPWHFIKDQTSSVQSASNRLLASSCVLHQMPVFCFPLVWVCTHIAMCVCLCLLCCHPPLLLSHVSSNLTLLAVLVHIPRSLQQIIIFIEKRAIALAGIHKPRLWLRRNDHCKSHCQPFMQAQSRLSRRLWCDSEGYSVSWRIQGYRL